MKFMNYLCTKSKDMNKWYQQYQYRYPLKVTDHRSNHFYLPVNTDIHVTIYGDSVVVRNVSFVHVVLFVTILCVLFMRFEILIATKLVCRPSCNLTLR